MNLWWSETRFELFRESYWSDHFLSHLKWLKLSELLYSDSKAPYRIPAIPGWWISTRNDIKIWSFHFLSEFFSQRLRKTTIRCDPLIFSRSRGNGTASDSWKSSKHMFQSKSKRFSISSWISLHMLSVINFGYLLKLFLNRAIQLKLTWYSCTDILKDTEDSLANKFFDW